MDLVLALVALCAVLLVIRLLRVRRRGLDGADAGPPSDDLPGRADLGSADARAAANRHSWMLGGGGSGG